MAAYPSFTDYKNDISAESKDKRKEQPATGKTNAAQFKELFRAFREMNKPMQNTAFKMRIPDFGLQKGEAMGLQIVNTNMINGELKGDITLIVTG